MNLEQLIHPDVYAEYSEPVDRSNYKKGDEVIALTLRGSIFRGVLADVRDDSERTSEVTVDQVGGGAACLSLESSEIRRKPRRVEMDEPTGFGQMVELVNKSSGTIEQYVRADANGLYYAWFGTSSNKWCAWLELLVRAKPGTLRPITAPLHNLTDEQVRALPVNFEVLLTNDRESSTTAMNENPDYQHGPYQLLRFEGSGE